MLSIDPGDDPGSHLPGGHPETAEGEPRGKGHAGHADAPAQPLRDIVPVQAMACGGTIIRPGAVAWGDTPGGEDGPLPGGRYSSCEAIEQALTAVSADPSKLPGLLAELATSRLWVPLPDRRRPFTDGAAVRLPLVSRQGAEFVPCFTSVQRLTAWVAQADPAHQRAGDPRAGEAGTVPHIVVPAAGLAGRLPGGLGLALNPDGAPGLPLYPECVPYLATAGAPRFELYRGADLDCLTLDGGTRLLIGHPPAEPSTLLAETRTALRAVPAVASASRAWLSVPGHGAGLVIAVGLDDPESTGDRAAATAAIEHAAAGIPLHVPFPLDVTFPGEPDGGTPATDAVDAWIEGNTGPFYVRL